LEVGYGQRRQIGVIVGVHEAQTSRLKVRLKKRRLTRAVRAGERDDDRMHLERERHRDLAGQNSRLIKRPVVRVLLIRDVPDWRRE
jgi:hypothetical protein